MKRPHSARFYIFAALSAYWLWLALWSALVWRVGPEFLLVPVLGLMSSWSYAMREHRMVPVNSECDHD